MTYGHCINSIVSPDLHHKSPVTHKLFAEACLEQDAQLQSLWHRNV